jgi:hypothetical protein
VPPTITVPYPKMRPRRVWSTSTLSTLSRFISIVCRESRPDL